LLWTLAGLAAVAVAVAALIAIFLPSDEALAQQAADALTQATGAPVTIGALHWQLLPRPTVVLTDVVAGADKKGVNSGDGKASEPAVTLQRVTLVPEVSWSAIQSRRLRLLRAEVDGATVQQRALAGFGSPANKEQPANADIATTTPLDQLVWQRVTWVSRNGIPVVLAGNATFDPGWRPRTATVQLPDAKVMADATLTRQGSEDRWALASRAGGGTATGDILLKTSATAWSLGGTLALQAIGVEDALQALNRRSIVSGLASGSTVLSANSSFADGPGQLAKSLRSDTRFTMGKSTLLRFDLDKAIRTAGSDTKGQTPLDTITGSVATRNTEEGMVIDFRDVKATSGVLSAVGQAQLANRQVDAEVTVDLVDGVVGVPLRINGPVSAVKVTVPPSALAGAAVGTAVLPGVGTALGARLGAAIGRLFGSEPSAPRKSAPAKP
jgi:hypothetical protein